MNDTDSIPSLTIGDIHVPLPIVQGGMSVGISLSGLSKAVTKAGGIGVIGAAGIGMLESDFDSSFHQANVRTLKREIRTAKQGVDNGPIGVNIMVALNDFPELVEVAVDEGADLLLIGAGLPLGNFPYEHVQKTEAKTVPIVSSGRAAKLIFRYWDKRYDAIPDGVVVEGPMAGGHLGLKPEEIEDPDHRLEKLVPEVIDEVQRFEEKFNKEIPVIAAGGIFTGADIYEFLQLGADGVQMGTKFVPTEECDASREFKQAYVQSNPEDIEIITSPVGLPGRAIKNNFLKSVEEGKKHPSACNWSCIEGCDRQDAPYCILAALKNAKLGNLDHGFAFAGSNAYRVQEIGTVEEVMDELVSEYQEAKNSQN